MTTPTRNEPAERLRTHDQTMATGLHECASDCPPVTSSQTVVRHGMPRPQRGLFAELFCSECNCLWSSRNGEANERQAEACGWDACPCHEAANTPRTAADRLRLFVARYRGGMDITEAVGLEDSVLVDDIESLLAEAAAPTLAEPLDVTLMRETMVSLDRILDGPRPRQWPMADQIAAQYNRLAAARREAH